MTVWTEPTECSICGSKNRDVHYRLVEWADALPGMRFAHVPCCEDESACRARVVASKKKWPIRERGAA